MSIAHRSASSLVLSGYVTITQIILGLLLVVIMAAPLAAQVRSSRGREFRVAFLPTDGDDPAPVYSIVISATRPTKGEIVYLYNKRSIPVDIPAANTPVAITLDTLGLVLPNATTFPISSASIRATFNDEVTLYGLNAERWSSDAFLGLPVESLGREYIVLAYPNTLSANPGQSTTGADFPSQFAIVATENGTYISIQPTAQFTSRDSRDSFTVKLDAGEVYLAQAAGQMGEDVSGTRMVASKPVVVYGSQQRANVPYTAATGRDHLVEQLPPVESWRSNAIVTPHFDIGRSVSSTDMARIIASRDSTVVTIGGVQRLLESSGSIIEVPLDRAFSITATHPILVAEYNGSAGDANAVTRENDTIGDPFMMLALSPGQYDTLYSFESFNSPNFTRHFVNLVMPEEGIPNLTLDGVPLNPFYKPVPLTSYMYAQIELPPGSHTLRSSLRFG
ncbi:MAG: IgGFc-binding protein, partial [Bacteroidota bacterium]